MTKKKPSAQLKKARVLINRGWCKGAWSLEVLHEYKNKPSEYVCHYCASGALNEVEKVWISIASEQLRLSAKRYAREKNYFAFTLTRFNDNQNTTKQDVLNVFDIAIKTLQKEGQ